MLTIALVCLHYLFSIWFTFFNLVDFFHLVYFFPFGLLFSISFTFFYFATYLLFYYVFFTSSVSLVNCNNICNFYLSVHRFVCMFVFYLHLVNLFAKLFKCLVFCFTVVGCLLFSVDDMVYLFINVILIYFFYVCIKL